MARSRKWSSLITPTWRWAWVYQQLITILHTNLSSLYYNLLLLKLENSRIFLIIRSNQRIVVRSYTCENICTYHGMNSLLYTHIWNNYTFSSIFFIWISDRVLLLCHPIWVKLQRLLPVILNYLSVQMA